MRIFWIIALIPALQGCPADQACNRSVTNTAEVANLTGRDVTIDVCTYGVKRPTSIAVPGQHTGKMAIDTHVEPWIKTGGPSNACSAVEESSTPSLASTSFNQVTLCRHSQDGTHVAIVNLGDECPDGFIAQMKPALADCGLHEVKTTADDYNDNTN